MTNSQQKKIKKGLFIDFRERERDILICCSTSICVHCIAVREKH